MASSDDHDADKAARLLGKGLALKREFRTTFTVSAEKQIDRALADCKRSLGEEKLQHLLAEGEAVSEASFLLGE